MRERRTLAGGGPAGNLRPDTTTAEAMRGTLRAPRSRLGVPVPEFRRPIRSRPYFSCNGCRVSSRRDRTPSPPMDGSDTSAPRKAHQINAVWRRGGLALDIGRLDGNAREANPADYGPSAFAKADLGQS